MCIGSDAHTKYELGRNYVSMTDFPTPVSFCKVYLRQNLTSLL